MSRSSQTDLPSLELVFSRIALFGISSGEDPDTLRIEESSGNFDLVRKHIEETVEVLNKMLKSNNKPFAFEVDDRGKVILVRACPLER